MSDFQAKQITMLWAAGFDSFDIAKELGLTEAEVENRIFNTISWRKRAA